MMLYIHNTTKREAGISVNVELANWWPLMAGSRSSVWLLIRPCVSSCYKWKLCVQCSQVIGYSERIVHAIHTTGCRL